MKPLLPFLSGLLFLVLNADPAQAQRRGKQPAAAPVPALERGTTAADGRRTGKWQFYTAAETLELTFDYDSSRISYLRPDTARYLVRVGEAWLPKRLARPPHLLGSHAQRLDMLLRSLRYPVSALREQLQGNVVIGYTVGTDGHTHDYTVESSLSPDCDQEVWRALQAVPDSWIPGVYLNRPAASRFYLAVKFQIIMSEAELQRQQAPPAIPRPPYASELVVTALGIERGVRMATPGR